MQTSDKPLIPILQSLNITDHHLQSFIFLDDQSSSHINCPETGKTTPPDHENYGLCANLIPKENGRNARRSWTTMSQTILVRIA